MLDIQHTSGRKRVILYEIIISFLPESLDANPGERAVAASLTRSGCV